MSCVLSLVYEIVLGFEADLLGGEVPADSSYILVLYYLAGSLEI